MLKPRDCPEFSNRAGKASAFTLSASGSKIHGKAIEMPETPESRCDFSSHGADLEWVMRLDCPEFGRGGGRRESGVKAVEDDRTPSPGGHAERRGTDERSWKLRRGVSEEGGRGAWPKDRFFQRLWQVGKSKMRDATESCAAAEGCEDAWQSWQRVAHAGHAFTAAGPRARVPVRKGNYLVPLAA